MLNPSYERDEAALGEPSLLIISHDEALRSLFERVFNTDYHLCFATDSLTALTALRQAAVDVILLDVSSTDGPSVNTLSQLRNSEYGAGLPVILISDEDSHQATVRGLQEGAKDYITRPLDENAIRSRIDTQIALKHAEDERKRNISRLKFTQEMQENFTRIVSHDLKGPLTNIRMAQFMLRDIVRDNDEAASILDNMDTTLNGMIEMLRVFLDAMDSQQLEPKLVKIEAHDLIVQVVEQYRLAAERKNIRLSLNDSDRPVVADERLLRQVLSNLVSNAIKFSPHGSEARIWTQLKGNCVRISIADEGPGIPAEEQRRLFQMFSKLSNRPTGGESSTGLGLWIVKELTQIQNGQVGVDQPASGGSVFWVELPAPTADGA